MGPPPASGLSDISGRAAEAFAAATEGPQAPQGTPTQSCAWGALTGPGDWGDEGTGTGRQSGPKHGAPSGAVETRTGEAAGPRGTCHAGAGTGGLAVAGLSGPRAGRDRSRPAPAPTGRGVSVMRPVPCLSGGIASPAVVPSGPDCPPSSGSAPGPPPHCHLPQGRLPARRCLASVSAPAALLTWPCGRTRGWGSQDC